jgi:tetratricopeptide (TPR) repeat protein
MEEIALFVLPSLTEGDDDTNSNAVRMSRHQGNPDEPPRTPGSSLKFSEIDWTERPQQDARHFVSLIESQNQNIEGQSTAAEGDVTPGTTRLAQDKERARLAEIEVAYKENELGNEHVETLRAKSRLVVAYDRIGQYEAAREVSIECVEGFKKVLGETEFETLESVQLLAFMQRRLDHFQEAEALLLEILEVRRETLGHQHTDTINTLANLSRVYLEQERWNDAEEHLTKTLESMVHVLGELHRDTLEMTSELAMTYAEQGRLEEAEQLGNQNLELVKSNLPQESNVRYRVLENMARIYGAQGRKGEACGFLREALDWAITWNGVDSPWAITSSKNLALWENEV